MEIRKLNSLRFLAAFIVFTSHYTNVTGMLNGTLGHGAGQMGLMLFFILSGFLMSYLYMKREFNRIEVRKFVVARIARIVPLFLFLVLLTYYLYLLGLRPLYGIDSLSDVIECLTLLRCDSLMWTLPVEIHFYMLFVLLWCVASKNVLYSFFFMAAAYYVVFAFGYPEFEGSFGIINYNVRTLLCLHYFFVGVVFGQLYGRWTPKVKSGFFVLSLLIIPLLFPYIFGEIFSTYHRYWKSIEVLFCMSLVFFTILFLVPDDNPILSNKVGDYLGKISYSMYLLHPLSFKVLRGPAREHFGVFFFICLALTIAISTASYYLIERPCRKAIRERFGA